MSTYQELCKQREELKREIEWTEAKCNTLLFNLEKLNERIERYFSDKNKNLNTGASNGL